MCVRSELWYCACCITLTAYLGTWWTWGLNICQFYYFLAICWWWQIVSWWDSMQTVSCNTDSISVSMDHYDAVIIVSWWAGYFLAIVFLSMIKYCKKSVDFNLVMESKEKKPKTRECVYQQVLLVCPKSDTLLCHRAPLFFKNNKVQKSVTLLQCDWFPHTMNTQLLVN